MRLGLYSHEYCEKHDMGAGHPERPERIAAFRRGLEAAGLRDRIRWLQAPRVSREALLRVHSSAYLDELESAAPLQGRVELDPDTHMNPATLEAARRAAGAGVAAVSALCREELDRAFCLVRPPGHHAEPDRAMGFCFFNNVACAAAQALANGFERVAILDFDVHHGNGTEAVFRDEPRVLFCSTFQHPFYPMSPLAQRTHLVHCPLPSGASSDAFRDAVHQHWWPAVRRFQPRLVLVSAGFDGHQSDPLAGLRLQDDDYTWVTREIVGMANEFSQGRVISFLEGGYDLGVLERAGTAHVRALLE